MQRSQMKSIASIAGQDQFDAWGTPVVNKGRCAELPNRRILVIDDNTSIHEDVRKLLSTRAGAPSGVGREAELLFGDPVAEDPDSCEFEINSVSQGLDGVELVRSSIPDRPYVIALIDIRMPPGIDGVETTRRIWEIDPNIQVVLCTAYSDYSLGDIRKVLGNNRPLLVLRKPYDPMELVLLASELTERWNYCRESESRIKTQSEYIEDSSRVLQILQACQDAMEEECRTLSARADILSHRIQQQTIELVGTREITCLALAQLAESRDPETGEHLRRMRAFTQILAEQLAADSQYSPLIDEQFLEDLWRSSPLHDIGKVGIPDSVLLKPGRLTPEEFDVMKQHTVIGANAIAMVRRQSEHGRFLEMAIDIAQSHHERIDGSGYPQGLKGDAIPLAARIVAVADVFDALTSKRVYKDAIDSDRAKAMICADVGTHFDPVVVDAFLLRFSELVAVRDEINRTGGGEFTSCQGKLCDRS